MKTIVEPKEHIDKLWGKQRIREDETYRMMRYVLRVDHDGEVLLHNVVTGRLVVLDLEEAQALDKLPLRYEPVLAELVVEHYLVPEGYDEFQQVQNLKMILRKLDEVHEQKGIITHYTILPTTACNARCYYCFEQGVKPVTMTEQTADDVTEFIKTHCAGNRVRLSWFGGEPTLAVDKINRICRGLLNSGIDYWSEITTNGYLLDEVLVEKAVRLWRLKSAMICVDGTEDSYNRTKRFVYANGNPYQIVMQNIGWLLNEGVRVNLRMNFDIGNSDEFADLLEEADERFHGHKNLGITAHPLIGEYKDHSGCVCHGNDAWLGKMIVELNECAQNAGFQSRKAVLPSLDHTSCMAANNSSVTITPEGNLVSCPEQFGQEQIKGNVRDGITSSRLVEDWKMVAVFNKCRDCVSFPHCVMMQHCRNAGNCLGQEEEVCLQRNTMLRELHDFEKSVTQE